MILVSQLLGIKRKALMKKVWFNVLEKGKRIVFNLVIRFVRKILSVLLIRVMSHIIDKLENAVKNQVVRCVDSIDSNLAERIMDIAASFGNSQARKWDSDPRFTSACVQVNRS